jgi:hypothetical protein
MTKPDKPAVAPKRKPATWTVYERVEHANVMSVETPTPEQIAGDVTVLIQRTLNVTARTGSDACWKIAEQNMRDRAQSSTPPVLCASRNGTAHGLTEARPYALKATVERVR